MRYSVHHAVIASEIHKNIGRLSHTEEMEFRRLVEADGPAYWRLRLEALQMEPRAFGSAVAEHLLTTPEETAARLREMQADSFILGAFEQHSLVAIATFVRETGLKERHKGHIYGVYVSASHRNKGLARTLLSTLIASGSEDASLEQILLAAACDSPAGRLYRRLGFEAYGVEPRALKVGGEYVDEEQMILKICRP